MRFDDDEKFFLDFEKYVTLDRDEYFYLPWLSVQGTGWADYQFPSAGIHPHYAGFRIGWTGTHFSGL